jgi:CDP-diglyceride synthetase
VPFMLQFLVRILLINGPHAATGLALALWLIAVSKFCDVGALLSGMTFGKHKMAPVISPKKTWEGAIGGLLTSAALGAGIVYSFSQYFPTDLTPLLAAAIALPIAGLGIRPRRVRHQTPRQHQGFRRNHPRHRRHVRPIRQPHPHVPRRLSYLQPALIPTSFSFLLILLFLSPPKFPPLTKEKD